MYIGSDVERGSHSMKIGLFAGSIVGNGDGELGMSKERAAMLCCLLMAETACAAKSTADACPSFWVCVDVRCQSAGEWEVT